MGGFTVLFWGRRLNGILGLSVNKSTGGNLSVSPHFFWRFSKIYIFRKQKEQSPNLVHSSVIFQFFLKKAFPSTSNVKWESPTLLVWRFSKQKKGKQKGHSPNLAQSSVSFLFVKNHHLRNGRSLINYPPISYLWYYWIRQSHSDMPVLALRVTTLASVLLWCCPPAFLALPRTKKRKKTIKGGSRVPGEPRAWSARQSDRLK